MVDAGEDYIVAAWKKEIQRAVGYKRAQLLIQTAQHSIGITKGLQAAGRELSILLEQYDLLSRQIEELMEQVAEELNKVPGAKAILSMRCVGVVTVASFYAEIGDLAGYAHPQQIIRHAGFNLKEDSSGQHKGKTMITKCGRSRLRRNLGSRIQNIAPVFYYTPGKSVEEKTIVDCTFGKLVRILFTLGTKLRNYDASKVLGPYWEAQLQGA